MIYNYYFDLLGPGYATSDPHILALRETGFFYQDPVPKELVGQPYLKLFIYMMKSSGKLCIGLYRRELQNGLPTWYVALNPSHDTTVRQDDALFVFGEKKVK
jgi:hypothetical protein